MAAGGVEAGSRRAELAAGLDAVRARIDAACAAAGRSPAEVTLVAVSKTWPASDVALLRGLGVTDFGENRDQEARPKAAALATAGGPAVTWHFVGRLQTNKCRSVVGYADVVHSVDRSRLVAALGAAASRDGRELTALVQVALDDADDRGGAPPATVVDLAAEVSGTPGLRLGGVMAVAPLGADPDAAFARLAGLAAAVRSAYPEAAVVSAGMSGDLEAAVRHGATHVRVGTALFGRRPPHVR